ncbi:MAG TPA: hypothetical protein VFI91_01310 [Longimicrobiaceae bacterium]|nr:hypothetical protein [Longimicrobiaceae bacterium]
MINRFLLLSLFMAVAACESATETQEEFVLSFSLAPADTIMDGDTVVFTRGQLGAFKDLRPIVAKSSTGQIILTGSFVAFCSNSDPEGSMDRSPDGVSLVIAFPPDGMDYCAEVPQPFTYMARISQVPAGLHHIIVKHEGDVLWGESPELEVVLDERIQVP